MEVDTGNGAHGDDGVEDHLRDGAKAMATSPPVTSLETARPLSQHPCPQALLARGTAVRGDIPGRDVFAPGRDMSSPKTQP